VWLCVFFFSLNICSVYRARRADERAVVQQALGSIFALLGVVIRELIEELGDRGFTTGSAILVMVAGVPPAWLQIDTAAPMEHKSQTMSEPGASHAVMVRRARLVALQRFFWRPAHC